LPAGVIQGVVLDWASGKPLSRTVIHLQPVAGSSTVNRVISHRSGRSGEFTYPSIADGLYLLTAEREGFLPASYGQRRPEGYGHPITVTKDSALFVELRMHRMGGLTGTVLDENGIGIPRVEVVAYRAELPLRTAGRGVADDRGVFRISGLQLGKHWVRSAGHLLDDGTGLLPTFSPEAREPSDGVVHEVRFDHDATDANVRPEPGRLASLSAKVACDHPTGSPVVVTISSESTRRVVQTSCDSVVSAAALPPAFYEIYADYADGSGSGYTELSLDRDAQTIVQLHTTEQTLIDVVDATSRRTTRMPIKLFGRRDDRSGLEPRREIAVPRGALAGGPWVLAAGVGPDQYVTSIVGGRLRAERVARRGIAPDGFSIFIEPSTTNRIAVFVSSNAAHLSGVALREGKPAPGMPVHLWPATETMRRILGGPKQLLTDVNGAFQFTGLPPGEYRVLPTMDVREISAQTVEESRAMSINLTEGQRARIEAAVWAAP